MFDRPDPDPDPELSYMLNTLIWGCPVTREEADELARRIVNTFRLTPPIREWSEVLAELPSDLAAATFARVREETETGGLTIGRFLARSRELRGAGRAPRSSSCRTCRGTGFVDCRDERRHGPGCSRNRTGVCACRALDRCPDCAVGHPVPPREDPPISFDEYLRRVRLRGDVEELGRWERFLGHSLR